MISLTSAIRTAGKALRANLGRSILTMLGIVIGIISIVLVISLGEGAQRLILNEVEGIGAQSIVLRPGRQPEGPTDIADTILSDSLKEKDVIALKNLQNVPGAASVDPAMFVPGNITYRDAIFRPTIFGWTSNAFERIFKITPAEGSFFTEDDIRLRVNVAVLGSNVKKELFGDANAINETVKIRGRSMRVVGVFAPRGQVAVFNLDDTVLVPYTTAQKTLLAVDHYHEIFITAKNDWDVNEVADDIRATIRETHNITDPEKDDFFVRTQQEAVEIIGTVTRVMTLFLSAIASIALVVGGIGIMNIMLVSVTERTQEIGLRKSVGASNRDILLQFLLEAVMLTGTGGIAGTAVAGGLLAIIALVARQYFGIDWPLVIPPSAILLGVGVATAVGLVFGIYPAHKAAQKDPIEALRYE